MVANAEVQLNDDKEESFLIRLNQLREIPRAEREKFLEGKIEIWGRIHPIFRDFLVDSNFRDAIIDLHDFSGYSDGGLTKIMNRWHSSGPDRGIIGGVSNLLCS